MSNISASVFRASGPMPSHAERATRQCAIHSVPRGSFTLRSYSMRTHIVADAISPQLVRVSAWPAHPYLSLIHI